MPKEIAINLLNKNFESIKKIDADGIEYWEARELMPLLGYKEWRKFEGVMAKAKNSCSANGQEIEDHFVGADKMIKIAKGTEKLKDNL
jgi:DNA-damage-inducible protein D